MVKSMSSDIHQLGRRPSLFRWRPSLLGWNIINIYIYTVYIYIYSRMKYGEQLLRGCLEMEPMWCHKAPAKLRQDLGKKEKIHSR